jgi:hypothetical protein
MKCALNEEQLQTAWQIHQPTQLHRLYSKISSEQAPNAQNQFSNTELGDFHALGA